jgi:hypothetical protein
VPPCHVLQRSEDGGVTVMETLVKEKVTSADRMERGAIREDGSAARPALFTSLR